MSSRQRIALSLRRLARPQRLHQQYTINKHQQTLHHETDNNGTARESEICSGHKTSLIFPIYDHRRNLLLNQPLNIFCR